MMRSVSRERQGHNSGQRNSHGYAICTRGYRGRLKLEFEDLAVERQAHFLDDDLRRCDFCHLYASLVKLNRTSSTCEQKHNIARIAEFCGCVNTQFFQIPAQSPTSRIAKP